MEQLEGAAKVRITLEDVRCICEGGNTALGNDDESELREGILGETHEAVTIIDSEQLLVDNGDDDNADSGSRQPRTVFATLMDVTCVDGVQRVGVLHEDYELTLHLVDSDITTCAEWCGLPVYSFEEWLADDDEDLELGPDFEEDDESSCDPIAERMERLLNTINALEIDVPRVDNYRELACDHYNALWMDRGRCKSASMTDDNDFLDRICVNFLRHEMSEYEIMVMQVQGGRYARDARPVRASRSASCRPLRMRILNWAMSVIAKSGRRTDNKMPVGSRRQLFISQSGALS